jgi:hypothetical protein
MEKELKGEEYIIEGITDRAIIIKNKSNNKLFVICACSICGEYAYLIISEINNKNYKNFYKEVEELYQSLKTKTS